jgi:tRNA threonylcarbamoyladenosine biosynthesis protein TsaE
MKEAITSFEGLANHAKKVLEHILQKKDTTNQTATVIALIGNLGAGKTAWTKVLAEYLGVEEIVNSPTFVILKNYRTPHSTFSTLTHIDAYRLTTKADLEKLGWSELVKDPKRIICIEWPSQVEGLVPEHAHKIHFTFIDEKTREIEVYYANE